ncbi:hypothetical protein LXL04_034803 [Taraxacum kok-saghyz]
MTRESADAKIAELIDLLNPKSSSPEPLTVNIYACSKPSKGDSKQKKVHSLDHVTKFVKLIYFWSQQSFTKFEPINPISTIGKMKSSKGHHEEEEEDYEEFGAKKDNTPSSNTSKDLIAENQLQVYQLHKKKPSTRQILNGVCLCLQKHRRPMEATDSWKLQGTRLIAINYPLNTGFVAPLSGHRLDLQTHFWKKNNERKFSSMYAFMKWHRIVEGEVIGLIAEDSSDFNIHFSNFVVAAIDFIIYPSSPQGITGGSNPKSKKNLLSLKGIVHLFCNIPTFSEEFIAFCGSHIEYFCDLCFIKLEHLIKMRLHIWYYIKWKPKTSFGIHVETSCICNKSVCYNFNELGEGVGINTHIMYSGAGTLLPVKLHGCVFIAGTQRVFLVIPIEKGIRFGFQELGSNLESESG